MRKDVDRKLLLYADDSALLVYCRSVADIENKLGVQLSSGSNWMVENKLSLHLGKTVSVCLEREETEIQVSTGISLW